MVARQRIKWGAKLQRMRAKRRLEYHAARSHAGDRLERLGRVHSDLARPVTEVGTMSTAQQKHVDRSPRASKLRHVAPYQMRSTDRQIEESQADDPNERGQTNDLNERAHIHAYTRRVHTSSTDRSRSAQHGQHRRVGPPDVLNDGGREVVLAVHLRHCTQTNETRASAGNQTACNAVLTHAAASNEVAKQELLRKQIEPVQATGAAPTKDDANHGSKSNAPPAK